MLQRLGDLPEQPSFRLKRVLESNRSRFRVKPDDLEGVIGQWTDGADVTEMFEALPAVKRSSITPHVSDWASGKARSSAWDDEFDQFVDFISSVLAGFLPWLFRAADSLRLVAGESQVDVPWREWADLCERRQPNRPEAK